MLRGVGQAGVEEAQGLESEDGLEIDAMKEFHLVHQGHHLTGMGQGRQDPIATLLQLVLKCRTALLSATSPKRTVPACRQKKGRAN